MRDSKNFTPPTAHGLSEFAKYIPKPDDSLREAAEKADGLGAEISGTEREIERLRARIKELAWQRVILVTVQGIVEALPGPRTIYITVNFDDPEGLQNARVLRDSLVNDLTRLGWEACTPDVGSEFKIKVKGPK